MKGLLLYHWYILRKKIIITLIISFFIGIISIMEQTHELATIYFISSFGLLITHDNKRESSNNSIMEQILPLKNYEIVGVKYILLFISLFLGICFTFIYLLLAHEVFDQKYEYLYILNIIWTLISSGLSMGSILIIKNNIYRKINYALYLLPIMQLAIVIYIKNSIHLKNLFSTIDLTIIQVINMLISIFIAVITIGTSIRISRS